jgi:hypothetical protein
MATDVTVQLHEAEIRELLNSEWFRRSLTGHGSRVTALARTMAPRRSGRGAASIHGETVAGPDGWEDRIGWDAAHAYMAGLASHAVQNAAYQVIGK